MKFVGIFFPPEMSKDRVFQFLIYSRSSDGKNDYKLVTIALDEDETKILSIDCTCAANAKREAVGEEKIRCKHIKKCIELLKFTGYLKGFEEEEVITNIKPKDL